MLAEFENEKRHFLPLIPILLFLGLYCSIGICLTLQGYEKAFYQFPAPSCALVAFAAALIIGRRDVNTHIKTFANGIGEETVVLMCLIFLLAGAFASLTLASGSVNATVQIALAAFPSSLVLPGVFLAACIVSFAMGTSMGTISTVAPIGIGLAEATGLHLPLVLGGIVGGAMFGDNLSLISDTTIAATTSQDCDLRDKMRANIKLAFMAAIVVMFFLITQTGHGPVPQQQDFGTAQNPIKALPYAVVLITALLGINVIVVLLLGIASAFAVGYLGGDLTFVQFGGQIYAGFMSMADVFFTSLLIAGLAAIAAKEGGLAWLLSKMRPLVSSAKSAEVGIAGLVSIADICVANNTVAIILTGKMAKRLAQQHQVPPARAASLLDIYSCVWQGVIPHGAQLLLISGMSGLSPFRIIPYVWYPMALFVVTSWSIWQKKI